jgi:hypothetical protein
MIAVVAAAAAAAGDPLSIRDRLQTGCSMVASDDDRDMRAVAAWPRVGAAAGESGRLPGT